MAADLTSNLQTVSSKEEVQSELIDIFKQLGRSPNLHTLASDNNSQGQVNFSGYGGL